MLLHEIISSLTSVFSLSRQKKPSSRNFQCLPHWHFMDGRGKARSQEKTGSQESKLLSVAFWLQLWQTGQTSKQLLDKAGETSYLALCGPNWTDKHSDLNKAWVWSWQKGNKTPGSLQGLAPVNLPSRPAPSTSRPDTILSSHLPE